MVRARGFSLIEAAIVLGIVGLVIGGIWIAAAAVQEKNNFRVFAEEMVQIGDNLRTLYRSQSMASADSTTLLRANIFPKNMGPNASLPWPTTISQVNAATDSITIWFEFPNNKFTYDLCYKIHRALIKLNMTAIAMDYPAEADGGPIGSGASESSADTVCNQIQMHPTSQSLQVSFTR